MSSSFTLQLSVHQHFGGTACRRQSLDSLTAVLLLGCCGLAVATSAWAGALVRAACAETQAGDCGFLEIPIGSQASATPLAFCDFRRELTAFRRCACDSKNV